MNSPKNNFNNFRNNANSILNKLGISPIAAIIAIVLTIIFPRFVILILVGMAFYWYGKNVGFKGRSGQTGRGQGRGCGRYPGGKAPSGKNTGGKRR